MSVFQRIRRRFAAGPRCAPPAGLPDGDFSRAGSPWEWRTACDAAPPRSGCCNICWWTGDAFPRAGHCEGAPCPNCGSIARDRFLLHCFVDRTPPGSYRVLETSPRLGDRYRAAMASWFDYRASDFDQRSHVASVQLDLQAIELEDASLDVLLTAHVLEHVPDTGRALGEIHRVLAAGGRMYLQLPVLQGATARPAAPEFHEDHTPVEWRFGPDLTEALREAGFEVRLLCTEGLARHVRAGADHWPDPTSPEFDVAAILAALRADDLTPVADDGLARRLGWYPSYMFLTWEARKLLDENR